jgi:hypothetical protein
MYWMTRALGLFLAAAAMCIAAAGEAQAADAPAASRAVHLSSPKFEVSWPVGRSAVVPAGRLLTVRVRAAAAAGRSELATVSLAEIEDGKRVRVHARRMHTGRLAFQLAATAGAQYELALKAGAMRYRSVVVTAQTPTTGAPSTPDASSPTTDAVPAATPASDDTIAVPDAAPSPDPTTSATSTQTADDPPAVDLPVIPLPDPPKTACGAITDAPALGLATDATLISAGDSVELRVTATGDSCVTIGRSYTWEHLVGDTWQPIVPIPELAFAMDAISLAPGHAVALPAQSGTNFPAGQYRVVIGGLVEPATRPATPVRATAVSGVIEIR